MKTQKRIRKNKLKKEQKLTGFQSKRKKTNWATLVEISEKDAVGYLPKWRTKTKQQRERD